MMVRLENKSAFVLEQVVSWDWVGDPRPNTLRVNLAGGNRFIVVPTNTPSPVEVEAILRTAFGPEATVLELTTRMLVQNEPGA